MRIISRVVVVLLLMAGLCPVTAHAAEDVDDGSSDDAAAMAAHRRAATEAGLSLGAVLERLRPRPLPQPGELTPNQITEAGALAVAEAQAACGPAAAVALARANGDSPTLDEAVILARRVGWTVEDGMSGVRGQVHLLAHLGVAARVEGGGGDIDWAEVARTVQDGTPVIVVTAGHYYVAERYDPEAERFDLANSATVLRAARGRRWFAPRELASLGMGVPLAVIHPVRPALRPASLTPEDGNADGWLELATGVS